MKKDFLDELEDIAEARAPGARERIDAAVAERQADRNRGVDPNNLGTLVENEDEDKPAKEALVEILNPPITDEDRALAASLFNDEEIAKLDILVRRYTASASFLHLVVDPGGVPRYRPSLYCAPRYKSDEAKALRPLADAYDHFQGAKGDPRRVFRG